MDITMRMMMRTTRCSCYLYKQWLFELHFCIRYEAFTSKIFPIFRFFGLCSMNTKICLSALHLHVCMPVAFNSRLFSLIGSNRIGTHCVNVSCWAQSTCNNLTRFFAWFFFQILPFPVEFKLNILDKIVFNMVMFFFRSTLCVLFMIKLKSTDFCLTQLCRFYEPDDIASISNMKRIFYKSNNVGTTKKSIISKFYFHSCIFHGANEINSIFFTKIAIHYIKNWIRSCSFFFHPIE